MIQQELNDAFEKHNRILTTQQAMKLGFHDATLRKAAEKGFVHQYSREIYFLDEIYFDDLYFMQLKHTKGVYSHETAVMLHTLSTYSPFYFHLSFPHG